MLYDAFLFFNELDLLEIRLAELATVVDRFVLVECAWTHQNRAKPLYFAEHRARFADWLPVVEHVIVRDRPADARPESLEPFHRNCLLRGLARAANDDLVMVSDLDEIPAAAAIGNYVPGTVMAFEQSLYYYWANCRMGQCTGTRIASVRMARQLTPQRLRHSDWALIRRDGAPNFGGWHFSYLGGAAAIREKTRAFCHPGCADKKWMNDRALARALETGEDLYGRGGRGSFLRIDETWPKHLRDHHERFRHFLKEP